MPIQDGWLCSGGQEIEKIRIGRFDLLMDFGSKIRVAWLLSGLDYLRQMLPGSRERAVNIEDRPQAMAEPE